MGTYTFRLPDIGEGIAEAEIVAWHVAVGDVVAEDGRIADMMTDKATVEMESPVSGRIVSIAGAVGDVVAIGSPLVVIETEGDGEVPAGSASVVPSEVEAPLEPSPLQGRGLGEGHSAPFQSLRAPVRPHAAKPAYFAPKGDSARS
jgi:2-oxoisovalerate dehydrogenase E2 component (dihydrolipoyl transacylase)